jgi:hypothetical protein
MRVPIYTADLSDKRGFKRIAKKLQRNWPDVTPLNLASAQGILSRGLGYRDFHDLQQSAEEGVPHSLLITQKEVRDGIVSSIFAFCQASKFASINESNLDRLVKLLPLQELRAFQEFNPGHPADLSSPTVLDTPLDAGWELPDPSNGISADHPDQLTDAGLNLSNTFTPKKLIDEKGLKFLWDVVQRRGNLRDQSCFAMLLQGIRPYELKLAKPLDFSRLDSVVLMRVRYAISPLKERYALLPDSYGHVVGRYIHEADLSVNDYLFPSKEDANTPMSSREMSRMIGSYLRDALADPEHRSTHRIRQSVIANTRKWGAISFSDMMGRLSSQ